MHNYGFFRVSAAVPPVKIGNPKANIEGIISAVDKAEKQKVDALVFPELSVTGYTCGDLFSQSLLQKESDKALLEIADATKKTSVCFAVGAPIEAFGKRFNCAVILCNGEILGIVPKSFLPNYGEFYEKRWFESGRNITKAVVKLLGKEIPFGIDLIFSHKGVKIGVEICEDLWVPQPPSSSLAMAGADVIFNLSASDDLIGKYDYLQSLIGQQSARCRCVYAYSSAGWGESSSDLVFSGKAILAYDGNVFSNLDRFLTQPFSKTGDFDIEKLRLDRTKFNTFVEDESISDKYRMIESGVKINSNNGLVPSIKVNPHPFVPSDKEKLNQRCEEIINIQSYGLMKRLEAIGCRKAVVGISGGLDSTLALLVTINAFKKLGLPLEGIIGITMPGLATSSRTKNNSISLMNAYGVTSKQISIKDVVDIHFRDIEQDPTLYDATFENSQARERTQILMDIANKENAIVIGTGDMSELALGWCTYNGDHMSMYGVNSSVPKTLVRHLVEWVASQSPKNISDILEDICATPISPELVPSTNDEDISQKTENIVGPYELHDFFLYNLLRNGFSPVKILFLATIAFDTKYDSQTILKWLKIFIKRFFSQQFKRSCMPDGPKVGSVNLSPRGDWRMPSDASADLWLQQLANLEIESKC